MTTGIQTADAPSKANQFQINELAFAAIQAVEALFYAYDPDELLKDSVIENIIWDVENTLIDFTYEIEEQVELLAEGTEVTEDEMPPHPWAPGTDDLDVEDPGVVAEDAVEGSDSA